MTTQEIFVVIINQVMSQCQHSSITITYDEQYNTICVDVYPQKVGQQETLDDNLTKVVQPQVDDYRITE